MPVSHRPDTYGPLAKAVHWLVAALVVAMFVLAWTFLYTPKGQTHDRLVALHQSVGAIVLVLMLGRIVGRIFSRFPAFPSSVTWVERGLARAVQILLYAALVIVPVTGWIFTNADGDEASFFGLFALPRLVEKDFAVRDSVWFFHKNGQYAILVLLALHVAGALRHHFLKKDDVLRRMLPGKSGAIPG
jgi:cytochrome b561